MHLYAHIFYDYECKITIMHSWGLCVFTQVLSLHIYIYYISINTSIITTYIYISYIHTTCINMHFAYINIHTHCVLLYPKIKFCIRGGMCVSLLKYHYYTYICIIYTLRV